MKLRAVSRIYVQNIGLQGSRLLLSPQHLNLLSGWNFGKFGAATGYEIISAGPLTNARSLLSAGAEGAGKNKRRGV